MAIGYILYRCYIALGPFASLSQEDMDDMALEMEDAHAEEAGKT